jgi:hypothetical protein
LIKLAANVRLRWPPTIKALALFVATGSPNKTAIPDARTKAELSVAASGSKRLRRRRLAGWLSSRTHPARSADA